MTRRRTKEQKIKKFSPKMQASLLLVFCAIILIFIMLIGRLFYLNKTDGERYAKKVLSQQSYSHKVIPYKRGSILDRNGTVLAKSVKVYNLILDPKVMLTSKKGSNGAQITPYVDPTISALVEAFGVDEADIRSVLKEKSTSSYVIYKKQISYEDKQKYEEIVARINKDMKGVFVKGVWFEDDYIRTYPLNSLASKVLGFTFSGNVGNNGIEGYYNKELNGVNGSQYGYFDADSEVEDVINPATNGYNLISTLDVNIQSIVEKKIKEFDEKIPNKNTSVIVMNPNNGEIYAMAESDNYDLNKPRDLSAYYSEAEIKKMSDEEYQKALNAMWRNTAVSNIFEPGSVVKPLVVAAALDEGKVAKNSSYVCDGKEVIGGHTIRCARRSGHGNISLEEVLAYSCNDGIMSIANKLGRLSFSNYQDAFGLSSRTGIDLPGEAYGIVYDEKGLNDTELATSSFGQSMSVSMVQVLAAFASTINGGYYYTPHVVKQITTENGAVVRTVEDEYQRQVISEDTSEIVREFMEATVESGTGKKAKIKGFEIGGKTGTAQKTPRSEDKYVVSFIGYAPVENPEVVVYVVIDEPEGEEYYDSSSIACELSKDIMTDIFPFLGIFSDEEPSDTTDKKPSASNSPSPSAGASPSPSASSSPSPSESTSPSSSASASPKPSNGAYDESEDNYDVLDEDSVPEQEQPKEQEDSSDSE